MATQELAKEAPAPRAKPEPLVPRVPLMTPVAHPLIQLQRSAGNLAVQSLVNEPTPTLEAPEAPPARTKRRAVVGTELPRSMLIELALERLSDPLIRDDTWIKAIRKELEQDLHAPAGNEEVLRERILRLHRTLAIVQGVFEPLDELAKRDNYLPELQSRIVDHVALIKNTYGAALRVAYSELDLEENTLADAERKLSAFPAFVIDAYLGPDGIPKLLDELSALRTQIEKIRAQKFEGTIVPAELRRQLTEHPIDKLLGVGQPGKVGVPEDALRRDLEVARAAGPGAANATETVRALTAKAQALTAMMTALALYEQCRYWEGELTYSIIDISIEFGKDLFEPLPIAGWQPGAPLPPREKEVWQLALQHRLEFGAILAQFQQLEGVSDPATVQTITEAATARLAAAVGPEFQRDVSRIEDRLETVETINILATIALITAAAALTAGVAGTAFGGAIEALGVTSTAAIGTAEVVGGAFAFTVVSRAGQKAAFGQAEGSALADFATNALMFGFLKRLDLAYSAAFRLAPEAGAAAKFAFGAGKVGTAMIALHAFAEVETLFTKNRAMTDDERAQSALQNLVLTVALAAGGFITTRIEARISESILAKLKPVFAKRLRGLATQREQLGTDLERLKSHQGPHDPKEVAQTLRRIERLWERELRMLEAAAERGTITQGELDPVLATYRTELARLELQLAQLNVPAQLGLQGPVFRPVAPGVVLFRRGGEQTLKDVYGDQLKPALRFEGMYEVRIGGELTYFVPEGRAFSRPVDAGRLVRVQEATRREATADPVAKSGLDNLVQAFGTLKADELLVSARPRDVGALLRALADPELAMFREPLEFYAALAKSRPALEFTQRHGAKALRNLVHRYGWQKALSADVFPRATVALERARSPEARARILEGLRTETDAARLESLLPRRRPPRPVAPTEPEPAEVAKPTFEEDISRTIESLKSEEVGGGKPLEEFITWPAPPPEPAAPAAAEPKSFREVLDGVDLSKLDAAERAVLVQKYQNYAKKPNPLLKSEDDYIRFVHGKRSKQIPADVHLPGFGMSIEAQVAIEAGRVAEAIQGLIRDTPKNNVLYPMKFWDPIRKLDVVKNVIPDFMPTGEIDASGRFASARTAAEAVVIADSKFTWNEAGKIDITDQIRAMIVLAKENGKPFVFLVREGANESILSSGIVAFAKAVGAEIHVVGVPPSALGLLR